MKINIKKMTTTAKIPTRGSEYAAGYDLYADITKELVIEPHETAKIGTGLSIEIPAPIIPTLLIFYASYFI